MNVFQHLKERGFLHSQTHDLDGQVTAYIGFDLTAPSLHVGSLIQLIVMKKLVESGHKVIALLGEATTRVGDPSMRDTSRPMLDDTTIAANRAGIEKIIRRIVPEAVVRSNMEWFGDDLSFIGFLREFGPHFTINRMNTFDTVKRRLENQQSMTFLEYTYMLLQAVDFLKLHERDGCTLQIGGSDQWGNIVNGVELVRRVHGVEVNGLTTVLLTNKAGAKMGKTASGAVWLDAEMTSAFDFFQFWRNVEDDRVRDLMLLFTDLAPAQIDSLISANVNHAKVALASTVTTLVHGSDEAAKAHHLAHQMFVDGSVAEVAVEPLPNEMISSLIHRLGWADSKGSARRLITGNAVALDAVKLTEDGPAVAGMLKVGKKHVAEIRAASDDYGSLTRFR